MAKYRKIPVVIEAWQWKGHSNQEGMVVRHFRRPDVPSNHRCGVWSCRKPMHDHGWIDTLESGHRVCPNDWIITGVEGEMYSCKPGIFEKTYELVEA